MDAVERKDIFFLDHVNMVSNQTKDLLNRMLTKDPSKRVTWKELFDKELTETESISLNFLHNRSDKD
jgi:hypothetical protein